METKRFIWADALKGWLIILVVLGHAIQHTLGNAAETNHLWNIIYSFHMPAFMAISGYLAFRPLKKGCINNNMLSSIVRRFRQLVIPFALWTFLLLLIKKASISNILNHFFNNNTFNYRLIYYLFLSLFF